MRSKLSGTVANFKKFSREYCKLRNLDLETFECLISKDKFPWAVKNGTNDELEGLFFFKNRLMSLMKNKHLCFFLLWKLNDVAFLRHCWTCFNVCNTGWSSVEYFYIFILLGVPVILSFLYQDCNSFSSQSSRFLFYSTLSHVQWKSQVS